MASLCSCTTVKSISAKQLRAEATFVAWRNLTNSRSAAWCNRGALKNGSNDNPYGERRTSLPHLGRIPVLAGQKLASYPFNDFLSKYFY